MHVHVHGAGGEAKFWLEPKLELAQNYGLSPKELRKAKRLVQSHEQRFAMPGISTLETEAEVTNISQHGFWLLVDDEERFLPFKDFPWFKEAPVGEILNVECPSPHHLYWSELDIDLALESITHPERFPLVSQTRSMQTNPKNLA